MLHHLLGHHVVLAKGSDEPGPDDGRRLLEEAVPDPVREAREEVRNEVSAHKPRGDGERLGRPMCLGREPGRERQRVGCEHHGAHQLERPLGEGVLGGWAHPRRIDRRRPGRTRNQGRLGGARSLEPTMDTQSSDLHVGRTRQAVAVARGAEAPWRAPRALPPP